MGFEEIFTKFIFPTALAIVLLIAMGKGIRIGWDYFVKKEQEAQARIDAAYKEAKEDREKFLIALNNQDARSAQIVDAIEKIITPVKESTEQNLMNMNTLIELVKLGNIERKTKR